MDIYQSENDLIWKQENNGLGLVQLQVLNYSIWWTFSKLNQPTLNEKEIHFSELKNPT